VIEEVRRIGVNLEVQIAQDENRDTTEEVRYSLKKLLRTAEEKYAQITAQRSQYLRQY
jgi:hypothetical protein